MELNAYTITDTYLMPPKMTDTDINTSGFGASLVLNISFLLHNYRACISVHIKAVQLKIFVGAFGMSQYIPQCLKFL